ncbi:hypothetical protein ABPG72_001179 [Tetrahymena utriculariae]
MSYNDQEDFFVDRYNFSRRVVDHRQPYDLNFSINSPVGSRVWFKAWKQKAIGNFLNLVGVHYAFYGAGFCILFIVADAWGREKYAQPYKSQILHGRQPYGHTFVQNYRNQATDLGRWNHNFACYEKQPGCGRDFD